MQEVECAADVGSKQASYEAKAATLGLLIIFDKDGCMIA